MKFAVVLSGCGVYDGAEIHEAVMTLLAVKKQGASYQVFAPDIMQHHVVNHLTGEIMNESRNVLTESARIARGKIKPLKEYMADNFDGIIFPGGFGVAKNLSSYAFDGPEMKIDKVVEKAIRETHEAGKPIGALCIAPVLVARILGGIEVTVGGEGDTAADIRAMGGIHLKTGNGDIIVDRKNKIVTSPCYMLDASITDIETGASEAVKAIIGLCKG
jgi:enhancing lycopene biosynthesis protein 2